MRRAESADGRIGRLVRWLTSTGGPPVAALLCLTAGAPLSAHEEPHERIERLSLEIEISPDDVELRLKRGGLHRINGHWEAALEDYDHVAELDPLYPTIDFLRARVLFEAGRPREARPLLDRFLAEHPTHVGALTVRAQTLQALGQPLAAARDYSWALAQLPHPTPVLFLERAEALAEAGEEHLVLAIRSLDDGIARLGPLVVLQLRAIDLEVRAERYDAAVARIDRMLSGMTESDRKETWLARRGEVLEEAGRLAEARASYLEALAAIDRLPGRPRRTPAVQELAADLSRRLEPAPGEPPAVGARD